MLTGAVALAVLACWAWPSRAARAGRGSAPAGRWDGWAVIAGWRRWRHRPRVGAEAWVADFAEVVAVGLDAGLDLRAAAGVSARSPSVRARAPWLLERLEAGLADGAGVAAALEGQPGTGREERADLEVLASAWRLAEEVGAGASAVTIAAAGVVRERIASRARTAAVVAGPRASMTLLTALPLVGPAAALLIGVSPTALYRSPAGATSALVGLLLTGTGWWWSRALLRRAARPGLTTGERR